MKTQVDPESLQQTSNPSTSKLPLFCFDLQTFSRPWIFVSTSIMVFSLFLIYGFFLELIFQLDGFRIHGWYLTLIQFAYYTVFSSIQLKLCTGDALNDRQIPMNLYFVIAFLTVATMGLSNSAVGYLNYPTQVVFKSCKLIPVLIGGYFIQGKQYNIYDISACILMSVGLICFTLVDNEVSPNFDTYGILLISLALCADAVIGNVQEKYMKAYKSSNLEMILYSYSIGFFYILVGLVTVGSLMDAFHFCWQHPMKTYGYAAVLSLSGYLGLSVVLFQVKYFGALTAVTVTTCRKAVTVVLSFVLFTKPFTIKYLFASAIVVAGIYCNLYSKNQAKCDAFINQIIGSLKLHLGFNKMSRATRTIEEIA